MNGEPGTAAPSATLLVEEIIDRYGSVEQFCNQLRHDLDDPTVELPRIPVVRSSGQRPVGTGNLAWSQATPKPPSRPAPDPPSRPAVQNPVSMPEDPGGPDSRGPAESNTAESNTLRGLWRRLRSLF